MYLLSFKPARMKTLVCALIICPILSFSQNAIWQATGEIPGGAISCIAVDSVANVYAGTVSDGLYRSTNGGASWHRINNGLGGLSVEALSVDHRGYVLALTDDALYRSTNHGEAWSSLYPFFRPTSVATTASGYMFVGASQDWNIGRFYRSNDDGATWGYLDIGRDPNMFSLRLNSSGHLFAATEIGVLRSTDNGTTWDSTATVPQVSYVYRLVITPHDEIFAAMNPQGVFKSTDDGETWTESGLSGESIEDLFIASNGWIYAATLGGIFRSTDSGTTWLQMNNGLTNTKATSITALNNSIIFAGTVGSGMFRSSNSGANWLQSTDGIVHKSMSTVAVNRNTNIVYVGVSYGGGLFQTVDGGNSWQQVGLQGRSIERLAIKPNGVMFATISTGVLKSTNDGVDWTNTNFPDTGPTDREVVISSTGNVFVVYPSLYRTTNDGETWEHVVNGLPPGQTVWDIAAGDSVLFAVVSNEFARKVYRSLDEGESWIEKSDGITTRRLYRIGVSPNGDVYAAQDSLFRSTDNGETWTLANNGLPQRPWVSGISFNSRGDIFLHRLSLDGKIFRSTNHGDDWEDFSLGLPETYFYDLAADNNDYLFAVGGGVFRTVGPTVSVEQSLSTIPAFSRLEQNYPNPFNAETQITFELAGRSQVRLEVFNILGEKVATLADGMMDAGQHRVSFNGNSTASGIYLVRMSVNGSISMRKMVLIR